MAITASAELHLYGPQPVKLAERLEIPISPEAVSAIDRDAGHVSFFLTVQNDHGCAWTLYAAQPPFLTDGTNRFPLSGPPAGPHFGALAADRPLALDFPLAGKGAGPLGWPSLPASTRTLRPPASSGSRCGRGSASGPKPPSIP